jgi:hypothetical protein
VAVSDRRSLWIGLVALLVAVVAAVLLLVLATSRGSGTSASGGAAGETIFRSGRDPSGRPIPRTGGMGGGMMGGGMMGDGCASCHGIDGHGRSTPMFTAPNITYANLTNPKGMLQSDGSRGPTCTGAGIRKAVTQGIDPEGDRPAWPMPQWRLTGQEWGDLLTFLKTLQ